MEGELLRIFGTISPKSIHTPNFGCLMELPIGTRPSTVCKILAVISEMHPELEYVPMIPAIATILDRRMKPDDTLACLAAIIEGHSIPAAKRQDWAYFPLHRRDHLVFERVFEDLLKSFAPKVHKHITKLQLRHPNYTPAWKELLYSLFIEILPSEIVLRIFDCYLVEGYKIILRFAIAHLLIRQDMILNCKAGDELNRAMLSPREQVETVEAYFSEAMCVRFDRSIVQRYRIRRRKHSLDDFTVQERRVVFERLIPEINQTSILVNDEYLRYIWSSIPKRMTLLNLELAYASARDGRHLINVMRACAKAEPLLLVIVTESGKILGVYVSKALTLEHGAKFYGTGETFIFSLCPQPAKYDGAPTSGNQMFICVTDQFMAFGLGKEFGLWIDKYVTQVFCSSSTTFNNPTLLNPSSPEDLRIREMEIFRFV